jgi:hypothetical protein
MKQDRNTPNQAANKSKAEGERWNSESDTVEQRDGSRSSDRTTEPDEGGGITNRPLEEEMRNQDLVPDRGESREGAHAGHGDRDRSGSDRTNMNEEE